MIVGDLNFSWAFVGPTEADSILVVYADAMLTGAITLQFLQPISRWRTKIRKKLGLIELVKLPDGNFPQRSRAYFTSLLGTLAIEDVFGCLIGERYDYV